MAELDDAAHGERSREFLLVANEQLTAQRLEPGDEAHQERAILQANATIGLALEPLVATAQPDDVDQYLAELRRTPSETLRTQMAFTPYVFEDVGALIDQSAPELYLFSSDYPHAEGGKDPIGRFEGSLGQRPDSVRDQFYAENFLRIFPDARVR